MAKRTKIVRVLLTEEEMARIKKAALDAGLPWATWIRVKALGEVKKDA